MSHFTTPLCTTELNGFNEQHNHHVVEIGLALLHTISFHSSFILMPFKPLFTYLTDSHPQFPSHLPRHIAVKWGLEIFFVKIDIP
ncbi:hypothetical protein SLEP1_g45071 [Rubroshorea leprosula]|uniref:Uncharacterized protein n=1 Tax=Rubroshorea leprosula TaxID=152421 RepID=A0AAV5LHX7_9ROSI|nr:hypothetical protein SLEP1_g45071 [Rubroshorea leprosula]